MSYRNTLRPCHRCDRPTRLLDYFGRPICRGCQAPVPRPQLPSARDYPHARRDVSQSGGT